jgi:hypothetical protein
MGSSSIKINQIHAAEQITPAKRASVYSSDGLRDKRPIERRAAHVQKVCYVPGGLRLCRSVRASSPAVVDLLGGMGPICVCTCSKCSPSFLPFTLSSPPPVGILRLAGTRVTRSKNKVALSFQRHTGVPCLQPDVVMLLLE